MNKYANCFIPDYGAGNPDYSPWTLTHDDPAQLAPDVLERHWDEYLAFVSTGEEDVLDQFYGYLADNFGYGIYQHMYPPVILVVP